MCIDFPYDDVTGKIRPLHDLLPNPKDFFSYRFKKVLTLLLQLLPYKGFICLLNIHKTSHIHAFGLRWFITHIKIWVRFYRKKRCLKVTRKSLKSFSQAPNVKPLVLLLWLNSTYLRTHACMHKTHKDTDTHSRCCCCCWKIHIINFFWMSSWINFLELLQEKKLFRYPFTLSFSLLLSFHTEKMATPTQIQRSEWTRNTIYRSTLIRR